MKLGAEQMMKVLDAHVAQQNKIIDALTMNNKSTSIGQLKKVSLFDLYNSLGGRKEEAIKHPLF